MNNELIFGKSTITGITNIEVDDETAVATLFKNDGTEEYIQSKFWLLTQKQHSSKQIRLPGSQHYSWLYETTNRKELMSAFNAVKKAGGDPFTVWNKQENILLREGITCFKGMKNPKDIPILSFDIEASGLVHNEDSKVYLVTNTFRDSAGKITRRRFYCDDYISEFDMLRDWCDWVREMNPSLMIGHNIYGYDLPYMNYCSGNDLPLGRNNSNIAFANRPSKFRKDGSQDYEFHDINIYGRDVVDTMFLSMKYDAATKKYESYGLKPIIKAEGLEKPGRTFIDASQMRRYYQERHTNPEMWQKVMTYADEDSDDALKLFDLMAPAVFYFTQSVSMPFQRMNIKATGAQLNNFMIRAYFQNGQSIAKTTDTNEHVIGGISFAVPGIYKNLVKIDLKSCYPSQILRFKLFDKRKDPMGYFYEMVHHFTYERFDLKKKFKETGDIYYYDREQSSKIFINSAFGLCNTPGLNYNSPDIARKITTESRAIIDMGLIWASGKNVDYWMKLFREKTGEDVTNNEV